MVEFLLGVAVVLVLGYVIAKNHHRFREFGIGTAAGTAVGSAAGPDAALPSVADVQGRADGPQIRPSGGDWGDDGPADSASDTTGSHGGDDS